MGNSRCTEKSSSWTANPRTTLRPRLPEIACVPTGSGVQKAPFALVAVGATQPAAAAADAETDAVLSLTPPGQPCPLFCAAQSAPDTYTGVPRIRLGRCA